MKTIMRITILMGMMFLFMIIVPTNAFSWTYEYGPFEISKMRLGNGNAQIALSPAPDGCNGGDNDRMHLEVNGESKFYKEIVAGLLTGHVTDKKLGYIWYNNEGTCSTSHVLLLEMFEFE